MSGDQLTPRPIHEHIAASRCRRVCSRALNEDCEISSMMMHLWVSARSAPTSVARTARNETYTEKYMSSYQHGSVHDLASVCETSVSPTVSGSSALALGFRPNASLRFSMTLLPVSPCRRNAAQRNACRMRIPAPSASPRLPRQGLEPGATDPVYTTLVRESQLSLRH